MNISVLVSDVGLLDYLELASRTRGLSKTETLRRVVDVVLREQMIRAVLDDGDRYYHEDVPRRRREPAATLGNRIAGRAQPPATIVPRQTRFRRGSGPEPTKAQMEDELRQAVLNTGGRLP